MRVFVSESGEQGGAGRPPAPRVVGWGLPPFRGGIWSLDHFYFISRLGWADILNQGTVDVLGETILRYRGRGWWVGVGAGDLALQDVWQHPWPLPTGRQ